MADFRKVSGLAAMLLGTVLFGAGCESQGPAERAGEAVDEGAQGVKDAIDPPGVTEKAGRAVDNAGKAVDNAVNP